MKLLNKDEFIANELRYLFIKKGMHEGDRVMSEREVAELFGVQRATVRSAFKILEDEGVVENVERSGRFITHSRMKTYFHQIKPYSEKAEELGVVLQSKLMAFEVVEVDKDLYKKIKLPIGTPVYKIVRIRNVVQGNSVTPISIEYAYIPEYRAPKLIQYDLEDSSIFGILCKYYHIVSGKREFGIEIVYANDYEAKYLQVDKLTALVRRSGITYDNQGEVIQYVNSIVNKEWFAFEQEDDDIEKRVMENVSRL